MYSTNNRESIFPKNPQYGQSYVPIQYIDKIFKPDAALKMGTLFPELVSPYTPGQSMREIEYLRRNNMREADSYDR